MIRPLSVLLLAFLIGGTALAGDANALPRSSPEKQGIPSPAILSLTNCHMASLSVLTTTIRSAEASGT